MHLSRSVEAIDTVNYVNQLNKVERYGVIGTAVELFRSSIYDVKQFVSLNTKNSTLKNTIIGVPQGGISVFLISLHLYK